MAVGLVLMISWCFFAYKRWLSHHVIGETISLVHFKHKLVILFLPGVLPFVIAVVPIFYFNHLLKQEIHCRELIKVNKIKSKDDPEIVKRCAELDLDELFAAER